MPVLTMKDADEDSCWFSTRGDPWRFGLVWTWISGLARVPKERVLRFELAYNSRFYGDTMPQTGLKLLLSGATGAGQ